MATPEQNTLLALQLFDRPAQQYAENSNQRLKVLMGIKQAEMEMAGRRELAGYQAQREDARWRAQGDREDARTEASDKRQGKAIEAAERRQAEAITAAERRAAELMTAKEKADIQNEIDRMYPLYAEAAARAGLPIKQRDEFESTRAGLGKLTAEGKIAERSWNDSQQDLSAKAAISELESKRAIVEEAKTRFDSLGKPTEQEETIARAAALNQLRTAIESGNFESTKSLRKDAISKGLEALGKGEVKVAEKFLGSEAVNAFQTANVTALESLESTKARLQDRRLAYQEYQTQLGDMRRIDSDLRKAQATNPKLAKQLAEFRDAPLQRLMTGDQPKPKNTFDSVTPARKTGAAAAPGATAAPGGTAGPTAAAESQYKYPGLSLYGVGERLRTPTPTMERWMQAPVNIVAAPGRAVDAVGRYGAAGINGVLTGDYTVPQVGMVTRAGEGLGGLIGNSPYMEPSRPPAGRQADIDRSARMLEWLGSDSTGNLSDRLAR